MDPVKKPRAEENSNNPTSSPIRRGLHARIKSEIRKEKPYVSSPVEELFLENILGESSTSHMQREFEWMSLQRRHIIIWSGTKQWVPRLDMLKIIAMTMALWCRKILHNLMQNRLKYCDDFPLQLSQILALFNLLRNMLY